MILLLWILTMLLVPAHQVSDLNCLAKNPGLLDAGFTFFNKFADAFEFWDVTKEDVAKHLGLFTTRFKRGHEFMPMCEPTQKILGDGLSLYETSSRNTFGFFQYGSPGRTDDFKEATCRHQRDYDSILKVNAGKKGPIVGLYIEDRMRTVEQDLAAAIFVFGPKPNSSFPIGRARADCLEDFKNSLVVRYSQRLDFLTCKINPSNKSTPEESADDVVRNCFKLQQTAISLNITAEIRCRVAYPSYGTTPDGVVGSVLGFQRFWCRIIEGILQNKSHPQIIMRNAFDYAPTDYKDKSVNLHEAKYHGGWWRRTHATSYETSLFVEKVEELHGGGGSANCRKECVLCNSSVDCCPGELCYSDSSFQPLEEGNPSKVCQNQYTICAPRPPSQTPVILSPATLISSQPRTKIPTSILTAEGSIFYPSTLWYLLFYVIIF